MLFNMDEFHYSLRGLKILLGAFLVLNLLAAILGPAAYKTMIWWHSTSPNALNEFLAGRPFPDYFNRVRWTLLLTSLPFLFIHCRLLSTPKIGFSGDFPWYSYCLRFYMLGVIWAVAVLAILLAVGAISIEKNLSFGTLFGALSSAMIGAFLVGLFEELVFRSLFFRMFYTAFPPAISVVLSSLFFAYAHFKHPLGLWNYDTPPADVGWLDGLVVGFWVIVGIVVNFNLVLFLNLVLVGYCLTIVFMKTRSLWTSIGLHAGWVTPILLFMKIAEHNEQAASLWWGSFRLTDGYFTTVCLLFFAVFFSRVYKPRKPSGYA